MKSQKISSLLMIFTMALFGAAVSGCGKKDKADKGGEQGGAAEPAKPAEGGGQPAAADPVAEAENIFKTRCETCHGATGAGDGPGAASLDPKPRAFSDADWQSSVQDDGIAKVIVEGGAAVGKSPIMPPNPDLKDKPEVVSNLVKKVRAFGGQ